MCITLHLEHINVACLPQGAQRMHVSCLWLRTLFCCILNPLIDKISVNAQIASTHPVLASFSSDEHQVNFKNTTEILLICTCLLGVLVEKNEHVWRVSNLNRCFEPAIQTCYPRTQSGLLRNNLSEFQTWEKKKAAFSRYTTIATSHVDIKQPKN